MAEAIAIIIAKGEFIAKQVINDLILLQINAQKLTEFDLTLFFNQNAQNQPFPVSILEINKYGIMV